MSAIKKRQLTLTTGGWQVVDSGAGEIVALVLDYAAASSSCVLTAYSGNAVSGGIQIFTRSSDTDAGTTVPIGLYTDGDLVAGTSTDNVKAGIPFHKGLFINKTGDTTHTVDITVLYRPLIKKSVNITTVGADGSAAGTAAVFDGPGRLVGYHWKTDQRVPSTADVTFKDSNVVGTGNTLMTKTNIGAGTPFTGAIRSVVTTTNSDEGGTGVTTAATGAYASPGIFFTRGLHIAVAQANAYDAAYEFDVLIDA